MKKIVVSFLAVALLISGCSLFTKDPQTAVTEGITKLTDVKKATSLLVLSGTINPPAQATPIQFTIEMSSKSDSSDVASPKTDTTIKATANANGTSVNANVLLRALDKKMYANVMNIDISGEQGDAIKAQLKDLFNVWWSFPIQAGSATNPAQDIQSKQTQIMDAFKKEQFFTNAKEEGKEMVAGMNLTKYHVDLDKAAAKKFFVDVMNLTDPTTKITPDDEKQLEADLKDVDFTGAVWLGDDGVLHRVKGTITYQPKDTTETGASIDIDYTGTDYGKDVVVVAPESPKEFNPSAILPLIGAFGSLGEGDTPVTPVTPTTPTKPTDTKTPAKTPTTPVK